MKNSIYRGFVFLFFSFICLSFLNATSISYGDDIEATLDTEGEMDSYSFEATAGDRIYIRARDAESPVDACIKLFGPAGQLIGEDCGDGGIVKLKGLNLPETGTYQIHFNDNNDNDTGAYGLSLELLNSIEYSTSISCGTDVVDVLDKAVQVKSYHFFAKQGEVAIFQMRSANKSLESEIEIYDESGNLLDSDYSSHLAKVKDFKFPTSGYYKVLLTDYNGNDLGEYGFSFQIVNRPECGNLLLCDSGDFGTEDSFVANIDQLAKIDAYFIKADVSESVILQMYSKVKGFDGQMTLYDAQGSILTSTTPKNGLLRIEYDAFPEKGYYMVIVGDNNGKDFSDYEIYFQRINGGDCTQSIGCSEIEQEGMIGSHGAMNAFSFTAIADTKIKIVVDPEDQEGLDPRLELFTPGGTKLLDEMSWDAVSSGEIALPEDGTYTILVSDHNGNDQGAFSIAVEVPGMVDNEKPVIDCAAAPVNLQLVGEEILLDAATLITSVSDNCGNVQLDLVTTSLNCSNLGENLVEVIATDDSGNQSSCLVTVILNDFGGICPPEYCEAKAYKADFEWIESVAVGDQVYTSNGNTGYFEHQEAISLYRNVDYTMVLTPGLQGNQKRYWRIWIDWNRDGDFEDEGEFRGQAKSRNAITHTFEVPDYAADRAFKMRIALKYGSYPDVCEVYDYGEVEDFWLKIDEETDCTNLPVNWKGTDIGDTPIPGSVCYQDPTKSFTVTGSGNDVYYTEDDFYFVFTELCGDGDIVAQVKSLQGTGEYALGGIMFRQNLNANAKYVGILATQEHGLMSQVRKSNGADTNAEKHAGDIPHWLKIERRGNDFTGFLSVDGITWNEIFSYELNMADCLDVGLAVASNNASSANTVVFENVEVIPFDGANGEAADRSEENNLDHKSFVVKQMSIAPNPASEFIWIDCPDCLGAEGLMTIYNIEGKLLFQQPVDGTTDRLYLDLVRNNFPNGQYLLSIKTSSFVATQKLLITK